MSDASDRNCPACEAVGGIGNSGSDTEAGSGFQMTL